MDATRLKNRLDGQLEELFQACRFDVLHADIAKERLKSILSGKPTPADKNLQPGQTVSAVTTVKSPPASPKRSGKLLSDAIDAYCKEYEHRWTPKTKREFAGMFDRILDLLSNPPLKSITRPTLVEFRDALAETRQVKTVNKYVQLLSMVLNYASVLQWISGNPAHKLGLQDNRREDEIRRAYTLDEVKAIFAALQADKPSFYSEGHHERYWLPLLGLYTGARVNELAQLGSDDVFIEDGIPTIRITSSGDSGKRLKSESSRRDIPVHNDLLSLGFMIYVNNIKAQKHERLFPALKLGPNGYSHYFVSRHFSGSNGWLRTNVPSIGDGMSFHGFRHTFASHLKNSEEPERLIEELMGHKNTSLSLGRYGKPYKLEIKQRAVNQVNYQLIPATKEESLEYWDEEVNCMLHCEFITCGATKIEIDPDSQETPITIRQLRRPDLHGYSIFHKDIFKFTDERGKPLE
jgi:integrase